MKAAFVALIITQIAVDFNGDGIYKNQITVDFRLTKGGGNCGDRQLKSTLNLGAPTTKQSKYIAFIRIFLYNIITVEKIIIVTQPFPAFYALIGEPPENERKLL